MKSVLIDSDVILDLFFNRKPHSDIASEIEIIRYFYAAFLQIILKERKNVNQNNLIT